ncbi:Uncharacterised protein [uncultured archaeon]|nr:Uncharacterised protein [uncultured archaeon]
MANQVAVLPALPVPVPEFYNIRRNFRQGDFHPVHAAIDVIPGIAEMPPAIHYPLGVFKDVLVISRIKYQDAARAQHVFEISQHGQAAFFIEHVGEGVPQAKHCVEPCFPALQFPQAAPIVQGHVKRVPLRARPGVRLFPEMPVNFVGSDAQAGLVQVERSAAGAQARVENVPAIVFGQVLEKERAFAAHPLFRIDQVVPETGELPGIS